VRQGYLELAATRTDSWFVVDGSQSEVDVARDIDERLATLNWSHG
jgi:thymidylate kinase